MGKVGKAVGVLIALGLLVILFVVPTMLAANTWLVWKVFWGYVEGVSNLTGLNQYLLTALALVMLVPFYVGVDMLFSIRGLVSRRWRYTGAAILLAMAVGYNVSLYYVTKEMAFAFAGGAAQKWYAITPKGVKYYDRPGFDTEYGIALQPVTPEIVVKLKLLEKGEFTPIHPSQKPLFNPITGQPQAWYYQYPDGRFEFYDKPGFHPVTGAPLKAVTQQIVLDWRKMQRSRPQSGGGGESSVNISGSPGAGSGTRPGAGSVGAPAAVDAAKAGGRTRPTVPLPVGPSVESSGTTTAALPRRSGIHPVGKEFKGSGYFYYGYSSGKAHLFNIEIVEGRFLRFNFDFEWRSIAAGAGPVDVHLDSPQDTAFLVDQLGRQHSLVQATGISADRPLGVDSGSSKRFTLAFPIPPEMESFKYQATLFMRSGKDEGRLHIRSEKAINLTDFR